MKYDAKIGLEHSLKTDMRWSVVVLRWPRALLKADQSQRHALQRKEYSLGGYLTGGGWLWRRINLLDLRPPATSESTSTGCQYAYL